MLLLLATTPAHVFAQGTPDPMLLPVATTSQVPLRSAYDLLNVPTLPAGGFYFDPTTGVKIYRVTSSTFPRSGVTKWTHDYSEGGNEISLPYTGDGVTRAVLVRSGNSSGPYWLLDFTPGVGVSNPRALGANDPCNELAFTFSNNPATPYYAYVGNCSKILRLDLRTMTEAPGNGWPVTGTNGSNTFWLHQSENDGVFTWMVGSSTNVRAYQPSTGILKSHNDSGVDEPRIERSGRFIGMSRGNPNNSLAVWDWQADSIVWTTGGDPGMIFAHVGSLRDRWLTSDFNDGFKFDRYIPDGTASTRATFLPGPLTGSTAYVSGNWINYPASGNLDDQWALTYYYGGIQAPSGYLSPGGTVYMNASGTNPQRRLVFHGYNTQSQYGYWMSAKSSSDGYYIMFNSDMNGSGRVDVFLAEMPVSGSGGNPVPAVSSLSPTSAAEGGAAFTLTVNGGNFVNGSTVRWNGANRTTTFVSAAQLTAAITAADIATAGTASVTVFSPTPGGGTSGAVSFSINGTGNPVPSLTSLSPSNVTVGGAAFTLTATGANFVDGSIVQWNGSNRTTTFVSSTQLTAAITAADIATAGTAAVRVVSPTPGGGTSSALTFTINVPGNPVPTLTSLAPSSATVGGAGFTLTATGTNFVSGSVVQWGGAVRTTTFVSSTQLTATIPAADIATAGTDAVTVFSPAPGGGTSNPLNFSTNNPAPVATSVSPSSAIAGGPAFTLTVNGSSFVPGSVVRFDGGNRVTTFVSSTQLTAAIQAVDILGAGSDQVTVFNPTPGGGTSAVVAFTTNNPAPTLTSLAPSSAAAGAAAFTLTVTGTNFVSGSTVRWNGANRTTTFVSATQVTAAITAADVATTGTASVTVFTGTPGGGTSSAQTFTIGAGSNPVPTLTSLSPSSATAGTAAFTLTATGTNFVAGSVIQWGGAARTTTFVSSTQLTAAVPAADVATAGTDAVTVFSPTPGGGTSNALNFNTNNPAPTLTSVSPSSATAGAAAFTLTATGTNFVAGSVIQWGGAARTTTFVSSTQLTAAIPAADVATAGTDAVTVFSPTPGGGTSSAVNFTTNNPAPTLTSVSPSSVTAGAAAFTLTVTGTNFVNGSTVRWNGANRTTTFVSATQLTAAITAADVATAGTVAVTVFTGTPGGGTSSAVTFAINAPANPAPTLTSLSPSSVTAGAAAFTLTATGTNFVNGSTVRWNGANRTTTFVSATQLTAAITAADIATAGTASVTVFTGTPGGGTSGVVTLIIESGTPPAAATLIAPSGSLSNGTPTYTWNAVPGATQYMLWVDDSSGGRIRTTYAAAQVGCASGLGTCSITPAIVLNPGAGVWYVVTSNSAGEGPWSTGLTFTVAGTPPPGAATQIAPSGTTTLTPTYTWNAVAAATQYMLWVDDSTGGRIRTWYTAAQAGCASGTGVCSLNPGVVLTAGAGQWWVITANASGSGPWSAGMTFAIPLLPPGQATLLTPTGSLPGTGATPAFTWSAVPGATQYLLWLDDSSGGRARTWYSAAQANCAGGAGTCSISPGILLNPGAGQWWIVTNNTAGDGPWSNAMTFTVAGTPPPGAATLVSPSGLTTSTPTFRWNAVAGATQYLLWMDDSSGGRVRTWYTAAQAGCGSGTGVCSIAPGLVLTSGAGQFWIITGNATGQGPWSASMSFIVP